MPLLKSEPTIFPDDLLDRDGDRQSDQLWWAVQTLSRQEKKLMRHLHSRQAAYYCPIVPKTYRSPAGRRRTSYLPLFSNYVFLCGSEEDRYATVSTGCVANCLPIADSDVFVSQIRAIREMINAECPMTVESKLTPGQTVRIKSGPFRGLEGVIASRRGKQRFIVAVDYLQQGASVALEDWEIEQI